MADSTDEESVAEPAPSCLIRIAWIEAERHKWIESEKAGCDLGLPAIAAWSRHHWPAWLRARWIEHLSGEATWPEWRKADFGLLQTDFHPNRTLVAEIVDQIRAGAENLDILLWAQAEARDETDTIEILARLNINGARLSFMRCSLEARLLAADVNLADLAA